MNHASTGGPVLAIHPTTQGFGYVLMASPLSPIDWGTREARGRNKNAACIKKVAHLIDAHQPDAIILEDPTAQGSRRSARIRRLSWAIATLAGDRAVDVHAYPRRMVHERFARVGARTGYEIATAIAMSVPAFERFLPPPRKIWMSEHPRMSIFMAAALAAVFFEAQDG